MTRHILSVLLLLAALFFPAAVQAQDGQLSTHVLDLAKGQPAEGVEIRLYQADGDAWKLVATQKTGKDGRVAGLLPGSNAGTYKLHFATAEYFRTRNQQSIYPYIEVVFRIEGQGHYHIPITLAANGYSTYRGS